MFTNVKLVTLAAAAAVMLMTGGAFAKTFEAVYSVNIHAHASKKSSVLDKLYEGERVTVKTCDDNEWCLINHDGPDGWVPVSSLERVGGGSEGPTIIVQGGFGFGPGHHHPKPPVVVDPGPHKPPFGPIVGTFPTSVDPGIGGGSGPVHPVHPIHPVGPIKPPKAPGHTLCDIKPLDCVGGGNQGGLGGFGGGHGLHM